MLVYIDNNILIDYEDGLKSLIRTSEINYVYSYFHLLEMLELGERLEEKKDKRLHLIEELSECSYVNKDEYNNPIMSFAKPSVIYRILKNPLSFLVFKEIRRKTSQWLADEDPQALMRELGIEKKVINNYTPHKLVKQYGEIINAYISQTCSCRQEEFQSLFNILDYLGFWQDKVKDGSTMNRLFDANHAYYATVCDYFVTEDKNTRNKSNVAYKMYGYKTKAISYKEFVKLITVDC